MIWTKSQRISSLARRSFHLWKPHHEKPKISTITKFNQCSLQLCNLQATTYPLVIKHGNGKASILFGDWGFPVAMFDDTGWYFYVFLETYWMGSRLYNLIFRYKFACHNMYYHICISGWWFQTYSIFHNIWDILSH